MRLAIRDIIELRRAHLEPLNAYLLVAMCLEAFQTARNSIWGCWVLTERALGEGPGSPRETESGRSLANGSNGLLGKGPRGKGTDSAGDGGHFGVLTGGIKSVGKKWEEGEFK